MDNLKAIPSWLLFVLAAYLAIVVSYAVFDGRRVDFWPPAIHGKGDDVVPLEKNPRYLAIIKELDSSEKQRMDLRDANLKVEQERANFKSRIHDLEKELQQQKKKTYKDVSKHPNASEKLSGRYISEQDGQPMVISHLSDVIYRLEGHGAWPWNGPAMLDGNMLYGIAKLKRSGRIIVIKGRLKDDAVIESELVFLIRENGKFYPIEESEGRGRVDPHTWYPER